MNLKTFAALSWNIPSKIGDHLGWNWLIYNPGVYLEFAMVARRNAPIFANALAKCYPECQRICDIGAGTGQFVKQVRLRGKNVIGFEYAYLGRLFAKLINIDLHRFDLIDKEPIKPKPELDLAYCLEVAEHVPYELSPKLVKLLTSLSPQVLFTAAGPGQVGHGHINCQPKEFWEDLFAREGFSRSHQKEMEFKRLLSSDPRVSWFLVENVMCFVQVLGSSKH